jgi:hypothetical protein
MRHWLLAGIVFLVAGQVRGQQAVAAKSETLVIRETSFNFGKIPQGRPVTHEFVVLNSGSTPLSLENVQASCGCTTPEWSRDPIPPGGTQKIKVGYNAVSEGPFDKSITIFYNKGQMKMLNIRGEVWKTPNEPAPKNSSIALITLKT